MNEAPAKPVTGPEAAAGLEFQGHHTYLVGSQPGWSYAGVMARLARVGVPGYPHHITQRRNRRQTTFFESGDYEGYVGLMSEWCGKYGVEVWAYCLMPNHVHLIVVPETEEGLRRARVPGTPYLTRPITIAHAISLAPGGP